MEISKRAPVCLSVSGKVAGGAVCLSALLAIVVVRPLPPPADLSGVPLVADDLGSLVLVGADDDVARVLGEHDLHQLPARRAVDPGLGIGRRRHRRRRGTHEGGRRSRSLLSFPRLPGMVTSNEYHNVLDIRTSR